MSRSLEKYKSIPLPVKASMWFFACSIIQKMISVVSTAVFTRLLTSEDYGMISIYNSWSEMLLILASLNLSVGCFNVGMTKYEEHRAEWVSSIQILSLIATTVFTIVFFAAYSATKQYINLPDNLIYIMFLTFYFSPAINIWTVKQRYNYSYTKLVAVTIGYTILVFSLSLIAILISSDKGAAKIIGSAIAVFLFGPPLLINNIKKSKPVAQKDYMRFALIYNLQMMPSCLGWVILSQIDRVMIDNMVSRESAGIYSVAYNAAFVVSIVVSSINATFNPWMMQKIKKNDYSKANSIGVGLSTMFLILIFAFILCAPEFVKIIAPEEYLEAIYIIPAVAGSTYFNLIYCLYSPILQYRLKAKQLSLTTVATAVLNIILNYFAIRRWGYIAAGYTTFICYFFYGWGAGFYAIYILKKEGLKAQVFDLRKLALATLVLTAMMILVPFTYHGYWIRYTVLLIVALFFILNAKKIIAPFLEMKGR